MKFKKGDRVVMLLDNQYWRGEVTVVSEYMGVKVMFDNSDGPAYWYYKPEELELEEDTRET
jgi:hypothetical protein